MSNTVKVFNFQAYLNNNEVPFLNTAWDGLDKSLKFMMNQFIQPKIGNNLSDFRGKDVALLRKAWDSRDLESLVKTFNAMADVRVEYESFVSEDLEAGTTSVALPQFPEYEEFDAEDVDSMFKGTFEEEASVTAEEELDTEEMEEAEVPVVVATASKQSVSVPVAKEEELEDTDDEDDSDDE